MSHRIIIHQEAPGVIFIYKSRVRRLSDRLRLCFEFSPKTDSRRHNSWLRRRRDGMQGGSVPCQAVFQILRQF